MTEKQIENDIIAWVNAHPGCFAHKMGNIPANKKRRRKLNELSGISDVVGYWRGTFIAIEVKSKSGKVSPEQQNFIDRVNSDGGIAFVARSVDDCRLNLF
jgi:penicillin-binding protein-related factor A (putative recombinase)